MVPETSVCLVDDDISSLSVMKLIIFGMGIVNIESFTDARQAWSYIRDGAPGVIVSDWNMDPMSGLELLALVRKSEITHDIPFIMVTANTSENYWRRAIKEGASDFLFKPFALSALRGAVEIALESSGKPVDRAARRLRL